MPVPGRFSGPSFMIGQLQEALALLALLCAIGWLVTMFVVRLFLVC